MIGTLAQLTENQQAVRDYFAEGGSILAAILMALGVLVIFFIAYALTRRQEHVRHDAVRNDPQELFRALAGDLELSSAQRRLLGSVAKESEIAHPAVLMLSSAMFREHADSWSKRKGGEADEKLLRSTAAVLFPTETRP